MRPPTALSIAESDPTGIAGLGADLTAFAALGVHGAGVVTSIAAPTPGGRRAQPLDGAIVAAQLSAALDAMPLDATKIGALGTAGTVTAVAEVLSARRGELGRVVLDPVMLQGGEAVMTAEGAEALRRLVLPLAHVLTPNLHEAAQLLGGALAETVEDMHHQARALQDLGVPVVVVTGGARHGDEAVDVVAHPGGVDVLRTARIDSPNTAGAGDTLSAAIAAQYARIAEFSRAGELDEIGEAGDADDDVTVVSSAREFLASAIENAAGWELVRSARRGPVNHLITLDRD